MPLDEAVAVIESERPNLVFAPHVETASGIILPDGYMKAIADAVHNIGGLFVLDCIASGGIWVDMKGIGVDVLISAPQKGWSASPCSGLVMLSKAAKTAVKASTSSSFACDLKKWLEIMEAYEKGGHAYHATLPTDALRGFRDAMLETEATGFEKVKAAQLELGARVADSLRNAALSVSPQRASARLASSSATPTIPASSPAPSLRPLACRPPLAYPSCATSPRTSRLSVWVSSASISWPTSIAPWATSKAPWMRCWALRTFGSSGAGLLSALI